MKRTMTSTLYGQAGMAVVSMAAEIPCQQAGQTQTSTATPTANDSMMRTNGSCFKPSSNVYRHPYGLPAAGRIELAARPQSLAVAADNMLDRLLEGLASTSEMRGQPPACVRTAILPLAAGDNQQTSTCSIDKQRNQAKQLHLHGRTCGTKTVEQLHVSNLRLDTADQLQLAAAELSAIKTAAPALSEYCPQHTKTPANCSFKESSKAPDDQKHTDSLGKFVLSLDSCQQCPASAAQQVNSMQRLSNSASCRGNRPGSLCSRHTGGGSFNAWSNTVSDCSDLGTTTGIAQPRSASRRSSNGCGSAKDGTRALPNNSPAASDAIGALLALQRAVTASDRMSASAGPAAQSLMTPDVRGLQLLPAAQNKLAISRNSISHDLSIPKMVDAADRAVSDEVSHLSNSSSGSGGAASTASTADVCAQAEATRKNCHKRGAGSKALAAGYAGPLDLPNTEVLGGPAAWLPQQHPAVIAALKKDLDPAYQQQQQGQQKNNQKLSTVPCAGTSSDGIGPKIKQTRPLELLPPLFPGTAPTLEFCAVSRQGLNLLIEQPLVVGSSSLQQTACQQAMAEQQLQVQENGVLQLHSVKAYVKYYKVANNAVKQVFRISGFKRTQGDGWHVLWGSLAPPDMLTGLNPLQKHNHFPGTWELGRKDRLYKTIAAAARRTKGKAFTFVPKFFVLPTDAEEFRLDLAQNPKTTYIHKPSASSRGRGVHVVQDARALDPAALTDVILQHYIPNPLLIGGRKFDLRVYVVVTCLDPLRVYVYREGLVRFASEQYSTSKSSFANTTMHLTNYSINKTAKGFHQPTKHASAQQHHNPQFKQEHIQGGYDAKDNCSADDDGLESEDDDAEVSKWSFGQLARYLQQHGHNWYHVWGQVCRICIETVIAAEPSLSSSTRSTGGPGLMRNCFEVFGFDILLDQKLRAWLLEVNTCPALNADSPLDTAVKTNMVADVLGLVGVTPCNKQVYEQQQATNRQTRLTGLTATSPSSAVASPSCSQLRQNAKVQAAIAATAAAKTVKDVEQLNLLAVPSDLLPECIIETEAEWRRCCRQQQRWQRVFPLVDPGSMQELMGLFETSRVSNAMVLRYYQQLKQHKGQQLQRQLKQ